MFVSVPSHRKLKLVLFFFAFAIISCIIFSLFISVSSNFLQEEVTNVPKRLVTGTNADLRKLPLKEAKEICRDYGVREEEVLFKTLECLLQECLLFASDLHFFRKLNRGSLKRMFLKRKNFRCFRLIR